MTNLFPEVTQPNMTPTPGLVSVWWLYNPQTCMILITLHQGTFQCNHLIYQGKQCYFILYFFLLSVLLWYTDFEYHFCIFKLFLFPNKGIEFVSFYDFYIWYWTILIPTSVVFFVLHFTVTLKFKRKQNSNKKMCKFVIYFF